MARLSQPTRAFSIAAWISAQPSPRLMEQARSPHHLIDVADPDHLWSLAVFQAAVEQAIVSVPHTRAVTLSCGGYWAVYTCSYSRVVTTQLTAPSPELRDALGTIGRKRWAHDGSTQLVWRSSILSPLPRIDPRNLRRPMPSLGSDPITGRALLRTAAVSGASPYRPASTWGSIRPRAELYALIDQRIQQMLEAGLVKEVRDLLSRFPRIHPPSQPLDTARSLLFCMVALRSQKPFHISNVLLAFSSAARRIGSSRTILISTGFPLILRQ